MSKGNKRGNKEVKKPRQPKKAPAAAAGDFAKAIASAPGMGGKKAR